MTKHWLGPYASAAADASLAEHKEYIVSMASACRRSAAGRWEQETISATTGSTEADNV
jgi:hypothetical protein